MAERTETECSHLGGIMWGNGGVWCSFQWGKEEEVTEEVQRRTHSMRQARMSRCSVVCCSPQTHGREKAGLKLSVAATGVWV